MTNTKQWFVGGVWGLFVAVSIIGVWRFYETHGQRSLSEKSGSTSIANTHSVREKFSFAPYLYTPSKFSANVPDARITFDELKNFQNFEHPVPPQMWDRIETVPFVFSQDQKQSLTTRHFFIAPIHDLWFERNPQSEVGRVDDWTQVYGKIEGSSDKHYRVPENAPFVSTDFALHVYHRLLEKEFERAEQTKLFSAVADLSQKLYTQAIKGVQGSSGEEKSSNERLAGYFLVPLVLTETAQEEAQSGLSVDTSADTVAATLTRVESHAREVTPEILARVKEEIQLIFEGTELQPSPLLGKYQIAVNPDYLEDYTQFTPRSHYAKNSVLRSYFRSMMWYGRQNFLSASPELMRDSLTVAYWMKDETLKKEWEMIYIPTTFFVGESDDLGIYEFQDLAGKLGNKEHWAIDDIGKAQQEIKTYRGPAILSSALAGDNVLSATKEDLLEGTRGFRFMGQRFTPDAFILNSLTGGDEAAGPAGKLPSMPTALMVMAAFGDKTSDPLLANWITRNASDNRIAIHTKLNELKEKFAGLSDDMWTQNIYWGWVRTFKTLFLHGKDLTGYPHFMKDETWRLKDTQAALGSWTELKHDTLLYAKQSYAEMGGGGEEPPMVPPVPMGYVEPNIEFWDRIIALQQMTSQGLNELGLLDQEMVGRNEQLLGSFQFFQSLALKEIENQKISEDEFERLRHEPARLNNVLMPLPGETSMEENGRSALIADVHTDVPGGQILYEATGIPDSIFVAIKDANGTRLTRGLVYSYYEFAGPLAKRYTDEVWRKAVYGDALGGSVAQGVGSDAAQPLGEGIPFPKKPEWTDRLK